MPPTSKRRRPPSRPTLAPATIHKVVQVLNKSVNAAVEDRIITHNPVARLPLPKVEHQEMRFLTSDELWTLADSIARDIAPSCCSPALAACASASCSACGGRASTCAPSCVRPVWTPSRSSSWKL